MKKQIIAAGLLLSAMAPAMAAPPHLPSVYNGGNFWKITGHDDASPVHTQLATQGICFLPPAIVGTHERGHWYSTTFPDWNGTYSQEGDQVFIYGDYAKDVGHDGMQISIDTANTASGHWKEWRENGAFGITIGFANATLQRIGKCRTVAATQLPVLGIPPRYLVTGAEAQGPAQANQRPVDLLASPYILEIFK